MCEALGRVHLIFEVKDDATAVCRKANSSNGFTVVRQQRNAIVASLPVIKNRAGHQYLRLTQSNDSHHVKCQTLWTCQSQVCTIQIRTMFNC